MLRVPTYQARPGMCLAMEVFHPRRGNILLKQGFTLDANLIRKLDELGVHELWIAFPGAEEIRRFISPSIQQQRSQLVSKIADLFGEIQKDKASRMELDFTVYRRAVRDLIEELVTDAAAASYISEASGSGACDLRHSTEVCFISLLLGLKLQDYIVHERSRLSASEAKNIGGLGLGAMLHDIGYLSIDDRARSRYLRTRDESNLDWQLHVSLGHKLVSGSIKPSAAGVILQHHQYADGSGFPREIEDEDGEPRGLRKHEIHVFARIACVANHFDRLHRLGDGTIQPRVRVLRDMMLGPWRSRFDPVVLAALPAVVPPFPPGSLVTLSDGDRAIVVDWDPSEPCRPTVQHVAGDESSGFHAVDESRLDLREVRELTITEHDGHDVTKDHFEGSEIRLSQNNAATPPDDSAAETLEHSSHGHDS